MRHYTNPMDNLSQCRVALQDAHQEMVNLKAELAAMRAERDATIAVLAAEFSFDHVALPSSVLEAAKLAAFVGKERCDAVDKCDATEAALRAWCERVQAEWTMWMAASDTDFAEDIRRQLCNEIANLKAAGLWREPTGGESRG